MYGIFDSHAHYDDEAFQEDRDALLQSLPKQGICGVINCASDLPTALESISLAQKYSFVFAAAGIHPHEAAKAPADWYEQLCALIENPKVVAVGEIGLDYHYDFSPRDLQKQLLIKQLALAKDCGLPVILHDREAHGDMMEILRKSSSQGRDALLFRQRGADAGNSGVGYVHRSWGRYHLQKCPGAGGGGKRGAVRPAPSGNRLPVYDAGSFPRQAKRFRVHPAYSGKNCGRAGNRRADACGPVPEKYLRAFLESQNPRYFT